MLATAKETKRTTEMKGRWSLVTLVLIGATGFCGCDGQKPPPKTKTAFTATTPLKVTDNRTVADAVPYSAWSPARSATNPPQNSELCLRADLTSKRAPILIQIPGVPADGRGQYSYRIVTEAGQEIISATVFQGADPSSNLSLTTADDEAVYLVQIGTGTGAGFSKSQEIKVRVVADRLNWWFFPFVDFVWVTRPPEKRQDTGDYASPQNATYARESLQSIYEFLKSTSAGAVPKSNWLNPDVSCFGDFLNKLRPTNGNDPLVNLNALPTKQLKLGAVVGGNLNTFDNKLTATRYTQKKQTTYTPGDTAPTVVADGHAERVTWATNATAAINDARLPKGRLLALWMKEGSMRLNNQDNATTYNTWPIIFSALSAAPPNNADDAKTIFIYDVAYISLGSDFLLKKSGGADNQPDLTDYAAALTFFRNAADALGGAGTGNRVLSHLTVTAIAGGGFTVAADGDFYKQMLMLAGRRYLSYWTNNDPDLTYMAYNMGTTKFNQMSATLSDPQYPERARLGLLFWAIHYEIRAHEWDGPRGNASVFCYLRQAFENKLP
jgi:hypothetical protein